MQIYMCFSTYLECGLKSLREKKMFLRKAVQKFDIQRTVHHDIFLY